VAEVDVEDVGRYGDVVVVGAVDDVVGWQTIAGSSEVSMKSKRVLNCKVRCTMLPSDSSGRSWVLLERNPL
jgi:hypothetical protein